MANDRTRTRCEDCGVVYVWILEGAAPVCADCSRAAERPDYHLADDDVFVATESNPLDCYDPAEGI